MEKLVIGCDVDGVLADFNTAYRQRLIDVTGRSLIPPFVNGHEPSVWYYATDEYGYTKEEDKAVWQNIIADKTFWENLTHYPGAPGFLWGLDCDIHLSDRNLDLYFITTRPGQQVKCQTERWLQDKGIDYPTVLIAGNAQAKGQIAAGLGLTHFIDDRDQNCYAVMHYSPNTQVYLLRHRYNAEVVNAADMIAKANVWRTNNTDDPYSAPKWPIIIDSLGQFTEAINGHRNARSAA